MNTGIPQAIYLNNTGVQYLLHGNYQKSIETFSWSVKALKAELRSKPADSEVESISATSSSIRLFLSTIEWQQQQQQQQQQQSSSFLFSHAFSIPPEAPEQKLSSRDIYVYCAVVIFNLALAHHLLSLTNNNNNTYNNSHNNSHNKARQKHQQRNQAGMLYTAALEILDQQASSCQHQNNCTAWLVQLACISNATQLLETSTAHVVAPSDRHLYHERACEALRHLSTNCGEVFEDPRLEGLLRHVLSLDPPTAAPAA